MFAWFQKLLPQSGTFFDQFEAHGVTIAKSAEALAKMVRGGPELAANIKRIEDVEHEADAITRAVLQDVRRIFLTPFDRGAITALISVMDDAVDQMYKTAGAAELYDVTSFTPEMVEMADIIVKASGVITQTLPLLRDVNGNAEKLHDLTAQLVRMEGEADAINARGLKAAFKELGGSNPTAFVVTNEIYRHLEKVCDKFEDVANQIDGIVIDHA